MGGDQGGVHAACLGAGSSPALRARRGPGTGDAPARPGLLNRTSPWRPIHRRVADQYDDPVKITGTIEDPSGKHGRMDAEGATYEQARQALDAKVPEGHKLIAIRTN